MNKGLKVIVSIILSILCIMVSIPVASAEGNDELIAKMSLEEKIGQMITVAVRQWNGEDFTIMEDEVANIITKNSVGGVILFAENLADTQQIVNLTTAFQNSALASKNKIPLFIGTDQE
ncbi:MAG: glycoside hydrolase family 3 N-terminal domain-containing protein, partial [Acutalibacteraceae bacterium]|nr:glycoside hydrolase family 3 N-terminal domain-containing protein [Acutalibacteraceae bacterium]